MPQPATAMGGFLQAQAYDSPTKFHLCDMDGQTFKHSLTFIFPDTQKPAIAPTTVHTYLRGT